jgi:UDP-3-O-[3-hydroxymyristoyl] glucosamine N-acyltransferase
MILVGGEREKKKATLEELATLVGGQVAGDPLLGVTGIAGLEEAGEGEITFLAELKNLPRLEKTKAAAAIVPLSVSTFSKPVIRTPNPYLAYAKIQAFFTHRPYRPRGVDPRAYLGQGTRIGQEVSIYPFVFIGDGCQIGDRAVLYPGVYVGESAQIGEESVLYPNVVVMDRCIIGKRAIIHPGTIIGSDGFGFARDGAQYVKIPQIGIVQVDDDVEIGANCAVDRAAMGKTWVKRGVKTDNLVQVGHNVTIGEDTVLVAQVGIAGSTEVGNRVALGGQVGVVGHIKIEMGSWSEASQELLRTFPPVKSFQEVPRFPTGIG